MVTQLSAVEVAPADEANVELVARVRPPAWRSPVPAPKYDLVVIGGGTAGLVCAAGAAGLGARVALVERHRLGGDCLNTGCVPSKALIRSARAVGELRRAAGLGVRPGDVPVDFAAVMERMRQRPLRPSRGTIRAERLPRASASTCSSATATLHRRRTVMVGDRSAPLRAGGHRHRWTSRDSAGARPRGGAALHQRDRLRLDRAAAASGDRRRRSDRLRTGAGVRALRRVGHRRRSRSADSPARGCRRGRDRASRRSRPTASRSCSASHWKIAARPPEGWRAALPTRAARPCPGSVAGDALLVAAGRAPNIEDLVSTPPASPPRSRASRSTTACGRPTPASTPRATSARRTSSRTLADALSRIVAAERVVLRAAERSARWSFRG